MNRWVIVGRGGDLQALGGHIRVHRVVDQLRKGAECPLVARAVGVQELGVRGRVPGDNPHSARGAGGAGHRDQGGESSHYASEGTFSTADSRSRVSTGGPGRVAEGSHRTPGPP